MRNIIMLSVLILFTLAIAGLISPISSMAEDRTCWFEARGSYDVYFIIREKTGSSGDREYVMWEGWVKKYRKKQYVSKTGQIRYDYKTSIDDRLYGDNHADCKGGNVIHVP